MMLCISRQLTAAIEQAAKFIRHDLPRSGGCPHAFLRPIADSPSLNHEFAELSSKLHRELGERAWKDLGGQRGYRGWPQFGAASPLAFLTLTRVFGQHGGFVYIDSNGMPWLYRALRRSNGGGAWPAIAITLNCLLDALTDGIGRGLRHQLHTHYRQRHTQRALGIGEYIESRVKIEDLVMITRLWSKAPCLLPSLYRSSVAHGQQEFRISREALAAALFDPRRRKPQGWKQQVALALTILGQIDLFHVQLSTTGWNPQFMGASPAIAELQERVDRYHVRLDPAFIKFLEPCFPKNKSFHAADLRRPVGAAK